MKKLVIGCLLLAVATSGCTTRKNAKAQAQAAYLAGQRQAAAEALARTQAQTQAQALPESSNVFIHGEVRTPAIPWTEDLTLVQAIVAAEYLGRFQPREIIVIRNGQSRRINPRRLLVGQDNQFLEPGDIIELRR